MSVALDVVAAAAPAAPAAPVLLDAIVGLIRMPKRDSPMQLGALNQNEIPSKKSFTRLTVSSFRAFNETPTM